jgi:hypothetical protein
MIVTWHKVPGKRHPENEPSRRVRSDAAGVRSDAMVDVGSPLAGNRRLNYDRR